MRVLTTTGGRLIAYARECRCAALGIVALIVGLSPGIVSAADTAYGDQQAVATADPPAQGVSGVPAGSGETDAAAVGIVLDEHLLTDPKRDMDYNGGGEITYSGARALRKDSWLDGILGGLDQALGIRDGGTDSAPAHAFSVGLLIFTPSDLRSPEPVIGDRPYASLFFCQGRPALHHRGWLHGLRLQSHGRCLGPRRGPGRAGRVARYDRQHPPGGLGAPDLGWR